MSNASLILSEKGLTQFCLCQIWRFLLTVRWVTWFHHLLQHSFKKLLKQRSRRLFAHIKLQNQRFQNGGKRRANADVFPVSAVSPRRRCFFWLFPRYVRSTFLFLFLSFFNCLDVFSEIYDRFSFQMELTLCGNVAEKWDIKCKQHLVTSIVFVNLPVHIMFPRCCNKLFLYLTQ